MEDHTFPDFYNGYLIVRHLLNNRKYVPLWMVAEATLLVADRRVKREVLS